MIEIRREVERRFVYAWLADAPTHCALCARDGVAGFLTFSNGRVWFCWSCIERIREGKATWRLTT